MKRKQMADQLDSMAEHKTPQTIMLEGLAAEGWTRLERGNPRRYRDAAGKEYLTFERDGARVATCGGTNLWYENGSVTVYQGDPTDVVIEGLLVDQDKRRQGRASAALETMTALADQTGISLYIQPVQLEEGSMGIEQLSAFYRAHGFCPQDKGGKVLVRRPSGETHADGGADEEFERPRAVA